MAKQSLLSSSIGRKYAMGLSALFLLVFLVTHVTINSLSLVNPVLFNKASHLMGTNTIIQAAMQPFLLGGVIFHFVMGFYLEIKNNSARKTKYAMFNGDANSTWMSRNMIWSGVVILAFLVLHMADFWIPEMTMKLGEGNWTGLNTAGEWRYYEELQHRFEHLWRVIFYVVCFVFLALHLLHGFQSSFQSVGLRHPKYMPLVKKIGVAYAIGIPALFSFIAIYHYVIQL